jgi:ABC-type branched-subunit amino acid transport system ATPase component
MAEEPALLDVRAIDFSYGHVQVLFGVDVSVAPGEVLALLGTNGAGKSTLLRVISGLGKQSRGTVAFRGRSIDGLAAHERMRAGIVQLPGGKAIFPGLTVAENLLVGAHTFKWDRRRIAERCDAVLELFPVLTERLEQAAGSMSGGEQQMLGLAKALLPEPEVLLIDELSLGLAPVVVESLIGVVERLKADSVTMVIVEQSVNIALTLADRAIFMEKGEIRFSGPAAELARRDDLVRAVFLGGPRG